MLGKVPSEGGGRLLAVARRRCPAAALAAVPFHGRVQAGSRAGGAESRRLLDAFTELLLLWAETIGPGKPAFKLYFYKRMKPLVVYTTGVLVTSREIKFLTDTLLLYIDGLFNLFFPAESLL